MAAKPKPAPAEDIPEASEEEKAAPLFIVEKGKRINVMGKWYEAGEVLPKLDPKGGIIAAGLHFKQIRVATDKEAAAAIKKDAEAADQPPVPGE